MADAQGTVRSALRRWWPLAALFVLVAAIGFANPARVGVMMVLPLYVFDRALAGSYAPGASFGRGRFLLSLMPLGAAPVVLIVSLGLALLSYRVLLHPGVIATQHFVSDLQRADLAEFRAHLRIFVNGWFDYLGGSSFGTETKPWEPFMRTFRIGVAIALTAVAVLELRDWRSHSDSVRRALFAAFLAAFVPVLVLFLLYKPLAQETSLSLRYFSVAFVILLMLGAWRIEQWLRGPSQLTMALLAGGCLLVATGAVYRMIPFGATFWTTRASPAMNLGELLRREGLHWGYATWWNAGATTVMSDMAVRVNPVEMSPQLLRPYPVMVDQHWYAPSAYQGTTFLVLGPKETTPAQRAYLETRLGPPRRVIEEAGFRIQVYDRNIAADFTCEMPSSGHDTALANADFRNVHLVAAQLTAPELDAGSVRGLFVRLRNDTGHSIMSSGAHPIMIGVHLHDADGALRDYDWLHAPLNCPLMPGEERTFGVMLPPAATGAHRITIDLVQEGVAWFADKGGVTLSLPLEIR